MLELDRYPQSRLVLQKAVEERIECYKRGNCCLSTTSISFFVYVLPCGPQGFLFSNRPGFSASGPIYPAQITLGSIPNFSQETVRALCSSSKNRYPSSWTSPEVKDLFDGISSPSSCITTVSAGFCRTTQPGHGNAAIAGLELGCIGVFLLIFAAAVFTFHVKRKKNPKQP